MAVEGRGGEPLAQLGRNPRGLAALLSTEWAVKTFLDSADIPASGHPKGSLGPQSWPVAKAAGLQKGGQAAAGKRGGGVRGEGRGIDSLKVTEHFLT